MNQKLLTHIFIPLNFVYMYGIFVYDHVLVHMSGYIVDMHTLTSMYNIQAWCWYGVSFSIILTLTVWSHWMQSSTPNSESLTCNLNESSWLQLSQQWDYKYATMFCFLCAWNLKSDPYACFVNNFSTESSLQRQM